MKIFYSEKTGEFVLAGTIKDVEDFVKGFGHTPVGIKTFKAGTPAYQFLHRLWSGLHDVRDDRPQCSYTLSRNVSVERV